MGSSLTVLEGFHSQCASNPFDKHHTISTGLHPSEYIYVWIKWPAFCRQHFQIPFLKFVLSNRLVQIMAWCWTGHNSLSEPGPWFNIKMSFYQYRKSHCGDKTVVRSSYLHNGISYAGKMSSLYWIGALLWPSLLLCKYVTWFWWVNPLSQLTYIYLWTGPHWPAPNSQPNHYLIGDIINSLWHSHSM